MTMNFLKWFKVTFDPLTAYLKFRILCQISLLELDEEDEEDEMGMGRARPQVELWWVGTRVIIY